VLLALTQAIVHHTIGAFDGASGLPVALRTVHDQPPTNGHPAAQPVRTAGLDIEAVERMIISSVVPPIDSTWLHGGPLFSHSGHVWAGTDLGLTCRYETL